MLKKYFYIILLTLFVPIFQLNAQEVKATNSNSTEVVNFYPNPVSNGKIYITSKQNLTKEITIFDVLGKKVFQVTQTSKEVNVSSLSPGVYIIKIKEGEATYTRKLIIK